MNHTTTECPSCHAHVTPSKPSKLWWIAVVALGLLLVPLSFVTVFLLPLNVALVPALFFFVAPLAAKLGERLSDDPRCPKCHGAIVESAPAAELSGRLSRPAHEGAMKRALV